jgi:hypothetical protein
MMARKRKALEDEEEEQDQASVASPKLNAAKKEPQSTSQKAPWVQPLPTF